MECACIPTSGTARAFRLQGFFLSVHGSGGTYQQNRQPEKTSHCPGGLLHMLPSAVSPEDAQVSNYKKPAETLCHPPSPMSSWRRRRHIPSHPVPTCPPALNLVEGAELQESLA